MDLLNNNENNNEEIDFTNDMDFTKGSHSGSVKKSGILLFILLVIIMLILLMFKSITIERKSPNTNTTVQEEVKEPSKKEEVKEEKQVEEEKDVVRVVDRDSIGELDLLEVAEPELGVLVEADALVGKKYIYTLGGSSYVYSIELIISMDDDIRRVQYLCSKKSYDSLSSGGSVKVSYQVDKSGGISISSISK